MMALQITESQMTLCQHQKQKIKVRAYLRDPRLILSKVFHVQRAMAAACIGLMFKEQWLVVIFRPHIAYIKH
jgi:hypothetical protein